MPIREDLVASAVNFLQDPNVASSPLENRISFLQSKNLTQEEIDASLARVGSPSTVASAPPQAAAGPVQQPPYYGHYQQQPSYGWQPPPPAPLKRDWRDWFIMATVMGGVSYGLYAITKRYIYPFVAPPTPERLDQDKGSVDEQYETVFATLEQLSKDTEALKASEEERSEKANRIFDELDAFIRDTRSASGRQEDDIDRLREDVKSLKNNIPKNIDTKMESTEGRLREIGNEIKSLKVLMGQRMSSASSVPATSMSANAGSYLRPTSGNGSATSPVATPSTPAVETEETEKENEDGKSNGSASASKQDYISSIGGRSSPFGSGMPGGKASIPSWQVSASKSSGSSS
ncbi:peroxisomal membrane anchor protein conserved region-domain-containing protein [Xylariales sp. AK1849]|nr:peroxisomal membrane anchor protein conserved region-domain-containing protein [Xylariales sp. AK1849]